MKIARRARGEDQEGLPDPARQRIRWLAIAAVWAWGFILPAAELGGQEVALPLGTQAPSASLEDLDGNPVQILDFIEEGKPTLIEFWASWCEQCAALQPQMDAVQREFGSQVTVIAVAVAVSQSPRRVKRHLEEHDPGYPFLWDGKGEAVRSYQVPTTSVVIILDEAGKVAYTGSGRNQDLVGAVQRILGDQRTVEARSPHPPPA
jgi:thiol-disulfide isomerase/thioredoxin